MFNQINGENNFVFDSLEASAYCPLCESYQKGLLTKILEERPGAKLVHTYCHNCQSFIVSLVVLNPFGISSIGLVSDLTSEDVLKFKEDRHINFDDVLDFYKYFKLNNKLI